MKTEWNCHWFPRVISDLESWNKGSEVFQEKSRRLDRNVFAETLGISPLRIHSLNLICGSTMSMACGERRRSVMR